MTSGSYFMLTVNHIILLVVTYLATVVIKIKVLNLFQIYVVAK